MISDELQRAFLPKAFLKYYKLCGIELRNIFELINNFLQKKIGKNFYGLYRKK